VKPIRSVIVFVALLWCLSGGCESVQQRIRRQELGRIDCAVEEEIEKDNIPGAVVLVGQRDKILYWTAFGYQVTEPYRVVMNKDTVFDMASLTKPIATATSIMVLADQKKIELCDYAGKYLPAFSCQGKEEVRISHLLTHSSGLPAYTNASELEEQFGTPCGDEVMEKICSLKALSEPGREFRYSCLGYITLGKIVEAVSGNNVADFAKENIFEPLRMKHTSYGPAESWKRNIAGTQIVEGRLLRGTVHDPLAKLMGGISGNAGLFSTAYDLSIYCRMLLNDGTWNGEKILSAEAISMLTTAQSHGRSYGFDLHSSYSWVKGSYSSEKAFCHTGYTGTSMVCDPVNGVYVIILTNRAHPDDKGTSKAIRTKVADIVFQAYKQCGL